jgi:hypothetical protein
MVRRRSCSRLGCSRLRWHRPHAGPRLAILERRRFSGSRVGGGASAFFSARAVPLPLTPRETKNQKKIARTPCPALSGSRRESRPGPYFRTLTKRTLCPDETLKRVRKWERRSIVLSLADGHSFCIGGVRCPPNVYAGSVRGVADKCPRARPSLPNAVGRVGRVAWQTCESHGCGRWSPASWRRHATGRRRTTPPPPKPARVYSAINRDAT